MKTPNSQHPQTPFQAELFPLLALPSLHVRLCLQEARAGEQSRELSRLKEEMSSLNIKLKWAQNKLQAETEAHKVCYATGEGRRRKGGVNMW